MVSVEEIADKIEEVLPKERPINHHEPFINKHRALIEISKCLTAGIQDYNPVEQFEEWIRNYTGAKYVLATNSGTSALHLALLVAGIKPNDEVVIPTTTFVATANAVSYIGAIPHFVDAGPYLDPNQLETYLYKLRNKGSRIRAIIAVHLFGNSCDIKYLVKIAKDYGLVLIEDACQALGTKVDNRHVGTFGHTGVFSFNNNKILTTNGGGVLITNDKDTYEKAYKLSIMGRVKHKYLIEHDSSGFNYRMSAVNASLGLSQTSDFEETLEKKRNLAKRYQESLGNLVEFVKPTIECSQNHWLNTILVDNRDELLEELNFRGIKARASFTPLHMLSFYDLFNQNYTDNIKEIEMIKSIEFFERAVCLPSGSLSIE